MFYKCRACLNYSDNMHFLTETEPHGKELIIMFTSINNFEWINNEALPSFLCNECEAALQISFEFKKKCLKSHEIIVEELDKNKEQLENTKVEETAFTCIVCSYMAYTFKALISHMSLVHREIEQNWCCYCNQTFDCLPQHRKSHKVLQTFTLCNKETNKNEPHFAGNKGYVNQGGDGLDKHKENKTNTVKKSQSLHCEKCNMKVRNFVNHMKKVHSRGVEKDSRKYLCFVCSRELKSKTSLKLHLKVHEGNTPHKCSFCGKPNKNKGQLVEHERTHTGEKPHICSICGKGFAQAGSLATHLKIHTGRPEVCKICDKRFCRPSELKLHLRKHSGEKPFLCAECGKTFIQKSHLMEHLRTHSDLRPYKCTNCDKAFKHKSLLNSHLQIHSGYKPFQCKLCEYACFKAYRLQEHMKSHDSYGRKKKMCVCKVCEKGFNTQVMLNAHMTSSHNAIL